MKAFDITGLDNIDKKLAGLQKELRKVVSAAEREGMKVVKRQTENNAPVGETGAIQASVKVRAGKRKRDYVSMLVQIGAVAFKGDTFYATFPEFGTKYQQPQHYMQLAYYESGEQALSITLGRLESDIKRLLF